MHGLVAMVAWRIGLAFALELEHTYELGIVGGVGLAGTVGGGSEEAVADDDDDDKADNDGDLGDATNDDDADDNNDNLAPGSVAATADNDNEEFDVAVVEGT